MSRSVKKTVALLAGALVVASLGVGSALAEVDLQDNLRVTFNGQISPKKLPRSGTAPVSVQMGKIAHGSRLSFSRRKRVRPELRSSRNWR